MTARTIDEWCPNPPLRDYGQLITGDHPRASSGPDNFPPHVTDDDPELSVSDFEWLLRNTPLEVFAPGRLTGGLTIHELFDAFARPHLLDGSTELWAECPVPCEATFLREMRENVGEPWGTTKIPPLRDVASLADALRIDDKRADATEPAHDPLNDARHSAQRLVSATARLLTLHT